MFGHKAAQDLGKASSATLNCGCRLHSMHEHYCPEFVVSYAGSLNGLGGHTYEIPASEYVLVDGVYYLDTEDDI